MEPKENDVWIYKRTGLPYVVESLCLIKTYKDGTENGWSKGVTYRPVVVTTLQNSLYVRELDEFEELFRKSTVGEPNKKDEV